MFVFVVNIGIFFCSWYNILFVIFFFFEFMDVIFGMGDKGLKLIVLCYCYFLNIGKGKLMFDDKVYFLFIVVFICYIQGFFLMCFGVGKNFCLMSEEVVVVIVLVQREFFMKFVRQLKLIFF